MTDGPGTLRKLVWHVPGVLSLGRAMHRLVDRRARASHALETAHRSAMFQPYDDTCEDRYPDLFDRLAEYLGPLANPRILSFGCSTGEEVRALRRRMPDAEITGVDLNPSVIAEARKVDPDHAKDYLVAGRPPPGCTFDAILALAVFRHGVLERYQPRSSTGVMPFARFEEAIAMLDRALAPGGYLAIFNAHFRFADTPVSAHYEADSLRLAGQLPQVPLYGPDDRRIAAVSEVPALYLKLG